MIETKTKGKKGGPGLGQGRKPKIYKEAVKSFPFTIPVSEKAYFSKLAKQKRDALVIPQPAKMKAVKNKYGL